MDKRSLPDERKVFLNVPLDAGYEKNFVALIASLTSLGRTPRCVLELPELGSGRLSRLFAHLEQCRISIHDLSRVGLPVRFNMAFELGLACAIRQYGQSHDYIIMEKKQYRLDRTLSDIKGRDPLIHDGSPRRIISCILDVLRTDSNNPNPLEVYKMTHQLWKIAGELKRRYATATIFNRSIFLTLVQAGNELAVAAGYLKE